MTNFDYYKAENLEEAYNLYNELDHVYYYAGGTELVTTIRKGKLNVDALIDIKGIDGITEINKDSLGACVTLNDLEQCQMLSDVASRIADHTVRNAITLGGNVCGRLPYKEMILPLLAMDATVEVYTNEGLKTYPVEEIFDKRFKIKPEDIVYKFHYKEAASYFYHRIEESTEVDYPLLTILIAKRSDSYFVGYSALSAAPVYKTFKSLDLNELTDYFSKLASPCTRCTVEYKIHLLKDVLTKALEVFND